MLHAVTGTVLQQLATSCIAAFIGSAVQHLSCCHTTDTLSSTAPILLSHHWHTSLHNAALQSYHHAARP
jgi:hypothetical protein